MSTAPLVDKRKDRTGVTSTYQTVQLKDGNIWLAENFNYFANKHVCQSDQGYSEYDEFYRKDGVGLYYDWKAFSTDMVPEGWHIPTVDEWNSIVSCYGGETHAYKALVEGGSSGLNLKLAGGTYFPRDPCNQLAIQGLGYYWSCSEGDDKRFAAMLHLVKERQLVNVIYLTKTFRCNVRLIKNK